MPHIFVPDHIYGEFDHRLEFFVPVRPKPMERGRVTRGTKFPTVYTVQEDYAYQDQVKQAFDRGALDSSDPIIYPWLGPCFITCHFLFAKPKAWYPGKPFSRSPDLDNLLKNVLDAMNAIKHKKTKEGKVIERSIGAWADDRQVCGFYGTKSYFDHEGTLVVIDFYKKDED